MESKLHQELKRIEEDEGEEEEECGESDRHRRSDMRTNVVEKEDEHKRGRREIVLGRGQAPDTLNERRDRRTNEIMPTTEDLVHSTERGQGKARGDK